MLRSLVAVSVAGAIAIVILPAQARPYPDTVAVCYAFTEADLEEGNIRPEVCVVSSGYGAGGDYTILNWNNGSRTRIIGGDQQDSVTSEWERRYRVTDAARELTDALVDYEPRGTWFETDPVESETEMPCYEVVNDDQVFCYRVQ